MSRVHNIITWVRRLCKVCPITGLSQELVRFDTQALQNPEISGTEYQQGELFGYEVREYLLEKWGRKCVYCKAENVPLEVEHIKPKSIGGSNRVSNLTIACRACNIKKANTAIEEFLSNKPSVLKKILTQTKKPLASCAAVNSTRWKLYEELKKILPTEVGSGGLTKYNRIRQKLPKTHWLDAACVGKVSNLLVLTNQPLLISAFGNCNRLVIQMDKYGFPRKGYKPKQKVPQWSTGDIVNVIAGKQVGLTNVRLKTVRRKGSFDIKLPNKKIIAVSRNHIVPVHRADGYSYSFGQL